jgi:aspartate racemase
MVETKVGDFMKTIGLIGGVSPESTTIYYREINRGIQSRLGKAHSARMILYSLEFQEFAELQHAGNWRTLSEIVVQAARTLEAAGADFLVICSNSVHKQAEDVTCNVSIPLLHIADPTGTAIRQAGLKRVGLLGTRFTMQERFLIGRLEDGFGLEVLVPNQRDQEAVHRVIYDELTKGIVRPESRHFYREVIERLGDAGAEGIILGCTEIMLLISKSDTSLPLFDTTTLHAEAAVCTSLEVEVEVQKSKRTASC